MQSTLFLDFECLYHIYNRGTNKSPIFLQEKDYTRFFSLWEKYMDPILDTYAYCLIPNHFHFMIKVKTEKEIKKNPKVTRLNEHEMHLYISRQFSNMFNAYSKYFNIKYDRVGKLFCERFKRKEINTDEYFTTLIRYIHTNPVKHGLAEDFRDYEYSSYWAIYLNQPTRLKRAEVLEMFGSLNNFEMAHFSTCEVVF